MQLTGEAAEQAAVVQWLRRRGALHFHPVNEGNFPAHYRRKLAAMGLVPGVSDLIIVTGPPLQLIALELKTADGRATQAQRDFLRRVEDAGGLGNVCHGREEAIAWLSSVLQ